MCMQNAMHIKEREKIKDELGGCGRKASRKEKEVKFSLPF